MKDCTVPGTMAEAVSDERTSSFFPGIEFDDTGLSAEERQLESTRQLLWEKVVGRLRAEFPVATEPDLSASD